MQVYGEDSYQPDHDKKRAQQSFGISNAECIILFLTGSFGFDIISYLVKLIVAKTVYDGTNAAYASGVINLASYCIMAALMVSLLYLFDPTGFKNKIKGMGNGRFWLYVFYFFLLITFASNIYANIEQAIKNAYGLSETNGNQKAINDLLKNYPQLIILPTAILAPISEEITYRQGLFEVVARKSKVWAYIVVAFVFGFIHIGSTLLTNAIQNTLTGTKIAIEFLALPEYMIGGACLAFTYDREQSVFSSIMVHMAYNSFIVIMTIIAYSYEAESSSSSASCSSASFISLINYEGKKGLSSF